MEVLGNYTLLERLATGGSGEIYRARLRGAGGFEKTVAVKRLRPELAQRAEHVERLIAEARLAARLTHGHIVQVLNLEQIQGVWLVVLEHVEGIDLFQLERALEHHDRRLGLEECVHLAKEVLVALDYVHRLSAEDGRPLGLVHGDVAPANVMINVGAEVKLLDFGMTTGPDLASLEGRALGGKIRYLSPELVRGRDFDARSDLYSTGILLWELLAGERIYESLELEAIMHAVARAEVPSIEVMRPGIPEGLVRVLETALALDPRQRYPHAAAFLRALEELQIGRDPVRSRLVLSEIVRVVRAAATASAPVRRAAEHTLEDALEDALD